MGQLILPHMPEPDAENQADLFSSLQPTLGQAAGSFAHSFGESQGFGALLRQKRFNDAGWTPWGSKPDYVDPKLLNEQYGIDGYLDFSKYGKRTADQAKLMYNEKLKEIDQADRRERATGLATAAGFTQDLAASMLDPLGMAVGFAITPARFIPGLRSLTPLVENASASFIPRASAAFAQTSVNAAAGMAVLEPFNHYTHQQMANDYTMANSLASIAFGGLAGGTLHVTGLGGYKVAQSAYKGLHWVADQVPTWMGKVDPATHEVALDVRLKQILNGDANASIEPILQTDPNLIAEAQVAKSLAEAKKANALNSGLEPKLTPEQATEFTSSLIKDMATHDYELSSKAPDLTFKERILKVKAEFDGKMEMLVKSVGIRLQYLSDGIVINGKHVKYSLQDITLNGRAFNYVKELNHDHLDFDAMTGGSISKSKKEPFGNYSEKTETVNSKGQKVPVAYGTLIREKDGRIWVVKPKGAFGGYKTSFSKGRLNAGEDAYAAAIRETFEETGLVVKGIGYLGEFERTTTNTHYMIAERVDGTPQAFGHETDGVELIDPIELMTRFADEGNKNDGEVLAKAINWIKQHEQDTSGGVDLGHVVKLAPEISKGLFGRATSQYATNPEHVVPVVTRQELGHQTGGQLGSNDGGKYTLHDGTEVYAKFPKSQEHLRSEVAAHLLYTTAAKQAGMQNIPSVWVVQEGGKDVGIATTWIDGLRAISPDDMAAKLKDPSLTFTEEMAIREMGGSWIFDAWLGNRDVYGTGPTWNIFRDSIGSYYKMDFGGSLAYRAQGAKKIDWGNNVIELDSMPTYAGKNLIKATKDSEVIGAEMVLRLSPDDIKSALSSAGFKDKELDAMYGTLIARQDGVRAAYPDVAHSVDGLYHNNTQHHSTKLASSWLKDVANKFKNLFTTMELKALSSYQGSSYGLNSDLWSGVIQGPHAKNIERLDSAMAKAPAMSDTQVTTLWRWEHVSWHNGLNSANIQETLAKTAFLFKSFGSTSAYHGVMSGRDLLWKIEAEPGVKGIPMKMLDLEHAKGVSDHFGDAELEVVLNRNQLMVIDTVEQMTNYDGKKYWQVNARMLNPDKLHSSPIDMLAKAKSIAEGSKGKIKLDETFGGDVDQFIHQFVDDVYNAQKPAEIPTLTDIVEKKTPLMKETEAEIAALEASVYEPIMKGEDEAAAKAFHAEIETSNEVIKKTAGFTDALKQAWACYKGL
jgi:8-oxo-dGTP pyrophosphatase MutT (NUDIX family)